MSQLEGHISLPQGPVIHDVGCTGQHTTPREPLVSFCHPLLPLPPLPLTWSTALVLSHHSSPSPCPSSPCPVPFSGSSALSPPHKE